MIMHAQEQNVYIENYLVTSANHKHIRGLATSRSIMSSTLNIHDMLGCQMTSVSNLIFLIEPIYESDAGPTYTSFQDSTSVPPSPRSHLEEPLTGMSPFHYKASQLNVFSRSMAASQIRPHIQPSCPWNPSSLKITKSLPPSRK